MSEADRKELQRLEREVAMLRETIEELTDMRPMPKGIEPIRVI